VSTTTLRAAIRDWADVTGYDSGVDTSGTLYLYDRSEHLYFVTESEGLYSVTRSSRGGAHDPYAWNLSEAHARRYLVQELGTHLRYARRLPNINRYHGLEDLPVDFRLSRGNHGADSLYRADALIGTFYSNGIAIPAIFYALIADVPIADLEVAYLAPDGGSLSAMVTPLD
jgi:Immunity protein 61